MCDSDHDYLGRADYHVVADRLRTEQENRGDVKSQEEWLIFQINYLEHEHVFHTITAKNIREKGKQNRILELKSELNALLAN